MILIPIWYKYLSYSRFKKNEEKNNSNLKINQ